ncbi:MAG TPA: hypothetical protein VGC76_10480 [Pyrinomonadaceae bacterium]|jgi:major membrane immunogen (membrane-anchored lipoprotein)
MKIKLLATFILAAFLLLSGCGKKDEANTNANVNRPTLATPTPIVKTNETAAVDTGTKQKIESALKAKGFTDVEVDTTTTPATLRGTVPKGKLAEAVQTAQEAGGKPVKNELKEK